MNHKSLAELCRKSYGESSFSINGVEFLHKETERNHVFAFRGTESVLIDMLRNLWIWQKSSAGEQVHAGYLNGWNHVEEMIPMHMVDLKLGATNKKPAILTGHSAGGSIALIGANEMLNKGIGVEAVVTFGAPKCMTEPDGALESITTQYIHHRDPVPSWLGHTDYKHVNKSYLGKECGWWRQSLDYHGIDVYEDLV